MQSRAERWRDPGGMPHNESMEQAGRALVVWVFMAFVVIVFGLILLRRRHSGKPGTLMSLIALLGAIGLIAIALIVGFGE